MKPRILVAVWVVAVSAGSAVACSSSPDAPGGDDGGSPGTGALDGSPSASDPDVPSHSEGMDGGSKLPLGAPISTSPSTWTWVDFPEAVCDDGTPTGIGIWPSPGSKKLMFFFAGGGACWNYETCDPKANKFAHGPFGATEFNKSAPSFGGWIIGHGADNPFKDWTTVFVPYCTGDLHAGDNVKTYTDADASVVTHHKGRANVAAYLARLAATLPDATQVAVTGSSAGGGGALLSYPAIRSYWPNAQGFMVDDSLPFFKNDIPADLRKTWFEAWNLDPLTTPICGANCVDDMSQLFPGLAKLYPNDRMGLISYTTDYVILGYYGINLLNYWKVLGDFTRSTLDPIPNFKHYYVDAWGHVTLANNPGGIHVAGVKLLDWVGQMASGDPAWKSVP